jgi:hypothetical protein
MRPVDALNVMEKHLSSPGIESRFSFSTCSSRLSSGREG